jgi:hypothetical protein
LNFYTFAGIKKPISEMKKLLTIVSAASIAFLVSCGPSAEEKQRIEQARVDSIDQANQQAMQDSMNRAMEQAHQDSVTAAQDATNKAMQDSMAALQSQVKEMNKPKPKPKPKTIEEKKNEEVKKATQGRG